MTFYVPSRIFRKVGKENLRGWIWDFLCETVKNTDDIKTIPPVIVLSTQGGCYVMHPNLLLENEEKCLDYLKTRVNA